MVNEISTHKHTVKLNDLEGSLPSPCEVSGQTRVVPKTHQGFLQSTQRGRHSKCSNQEDIFGSCELFSSPDPGGHGQVKINSFTLDKI